MCGNFCSAKCSPDDVRSLTYCVVDVFRCLLCKPSHGDLLRRLFLDSGGTDVVHRVSYLASPRLRFVFPRQRGADPEQTQRELSSSLQNEVLEKLVVEHDHVERWWTRVSLSMPFLRIGDA